MEFKSHSLFIFAPCRALQSSLPHNFASYKEGGENLYLIKQYREAKGLSQLDLAKQFFVHSIERKYVAVVWGNITEDEGTIEGNIGRDPADRLRFKVFPDGSQGKTAITHYRVLERFGFVTVVECVLETGRTHQIRVHMNYIGHPLFNDDRYDGNQIRKGTIYAKYTRFIRNCFEILPRQALHAKTLGFIHPRTGKPIRFDSPLPEDMKQLIEKWRRYSSDMTEFED